MLKNAWFYIFAVMLLGAGGWYYYESQRTVLMAPQTQPSAPVIIVQPAPMQADPELNKRREEGIGSIRNLKPVPIPPAPTNSPHK